MKVVYRNSNEVVCPSCKSPRVDIELFDMTPDKKTFNDIAYCIDCGETFELVTKRKEN